MARDRSRNKCAVIPDDNLRKEWRQFARQEFERNREVDDLSQIRYLISTGKTQFDEMRRYAEERAIATKALNEKI
ncbi:MAG: hypothetical protein M1823_000132 [Watsoniomyces obsoletus]|nr:MAG: hypothetical protein M1823_000132 [Watsoniomyces obsoletus]